jgi:hypothetical protein
MENDETLNAKAAITASALRYIFMGSLTVKKLARLFKASPATIST